MIRHRPNKAFVWDKERIKMAWSPFATRFARPQKAARNLSLEEMEEKRFGGLERS